MQVCRIFRSTEDQSCEGSAVGLWHWQPRRWLAFGWYPGRIKKKERTIRILYKIVDRDPMGENSRASSLAHCFSVHPPIHTHTTLKLKKQTELDLNFKGTPRGKYWMQFPKITNRALKREPKLAKQAANVLLTRYFFSLLHSHMAIRKKKKLKY